MFYDPAQFPFLAPLREAWRDILAEYEALGAEPLRWISPEHNGGWKMVVMRVFDKWHVDPARVPTVARLTAELPGFQTCQFSIMEPGGVLDWHTDPRPFTVRSHLGLVCPKGAYLESEDQVRPFQNGEFMLFNESKPHKSWNESAERRVTFIFGFDLDPAQPEPDAQRDYDIAVRIWKDMHNG